MSFHEILIAVMAAFAVLGAVDRIFGNRWGLGKEFLSHCSFFSISTPYTWQRLFQYSCLLQANLFNPGS